MDPTARLADVKAKLLALIEQHEDPAALEGRGDIITFLDSLRELAESIDALEKPRIHLGR